jgi:hypothetical protein
MDIAEPADVSVHDSGAIAPTLPAATNPRPLRKEDPAVLVPIPAPPRKNPARRRSPLTPYPPTALHLVRPSYSLQHHYVPRKPSRLVIPAREIRPRLNPTCHSDAEGGGIFLAATACFASKPCSSADTVCGCRNVARQAHNRQCRCNANRSWMDRENARARARPRAEQ